MQSQILSDSGNQTQISTPLLFRFQEPLQLRFWDAHLPKEPHSFEVVSTEYSPYFSESHGNFLCHMLHQQILYGSFYVKG
ncbi:hypothetical protein VCHA29O37_580006 [Vibrio chagasii]|nr:hypothetical protein VCHA29O37_580006 [Vibrio chagasii]